MPTRQISSPRWEVRRAQRLLRSRFGFRISQAKLGLEARSGRDGRGVRAVRACPERLIALSYDDGPSPANTPELLEILEDAAACATFFAVGERAERHPDLVEAALRGGHELASHTYTHANPRYLDVEGLRVEIERGHAAVAAVAGGAALFRPPFGKRPRESARICASLGLTSVLWSVDSGDTMPFRTERIVREVVERTRPGAIVLMHDGGGRRNVTLDATRRILDELGSRGYGFVTVSELLRNEQPSKRSGSEMPHSSA